jgi:YhcH/YjgK/YiaL family protein
VIHDKLVNWKLYFSGEPWKTAFDYLLGLSSETPLAQKVLLRSDGLYASVMSYQTRGTKESVLETHDHFVDIQVTLSGCEGIDWFDREILQIKTPYDTELDRTFYHRPDTACTHVNNDPGYFTLLFPSDAHMPMLRGKGESKMVKKVVVKVPIDSLQP